MLNYLERLRALVGPRARAALLAVLALTGAIVVVVDLDGDGKDDIVIRVDSADRDTKPDVTLTIPAAAVENAEKSGVAGHRAASDEAPAAASADELADAKQQQADFARDDQLPDAPLAAPSQAGCVYRGVANQSSRGGVKPRLFVLHYTVSANRAGWDDVNAIVGLFDRPSFSASSHFVIDREGHCAYIVPETAKAWTQAAGNPVSISVEIINTGSEASLISGAGLAKLGRVISDSTKRWGIPLQVGKVSGCKVVRPGVIDHRTFGACGGGHHDVGPYTIDAPLVAAKAARAAFPAWSRGSSGPMTFGWAEPRPEASCARRWARARTRSSSSASA